MKFRAEKMKFCSAASTCWRRLAEDGASTLHDTHCYPCSPSETRSVQSEVRRAQQESFGAIDKVHRFLAKNPCGAQKCAAHSLHRLTQTKTGRDDQSRQPIRRWWSDRSKGRACMGDKVGARTEQTSSRIGTWSGQHRSGIRMEKVNTPSHPAAAMESCK